MCGLAESLRVMGLRVVTLVPDLGPWNGQLTFSKGWAQISFEAEEVEGVSLMPTDSCYSGQVRQVARRCNWAEGPGPGREPRAPQGRHSLCWSQMWESGRRRKRRGSWESLLSGLSPWTAAGECSWWMEEGL